MRSDGLRLAGAFHRPVAQPPASGMPCMVVAPGWSCRRGPRLDATVTALADAGYAVLAFDFRGYGESEGPEGRLFPLEQAEDIRAAVAHARSYDSIDPDRVSVLGTLNGAAAALHAASDDRTIAGVVAFFPFGDGATWLRSLRRYWEWRAFLKLIEHDRATRQRNGVSELVDAESEVLVRGPERVDASTVRRAPEIERRPPRQLTLESVEAILAFRPQDHVHRISPRPVIVIGVEEDLMIPIDEVQRLYERVRDPRALIQLSGISHHDIYDASRYRSLVRSIAARLEELQARSGAPMRSADRSVGG